MLFLYTFIYYLLLPFILLRLWVRSKKLPSYAKRWQERFACFDAPAKKGGIWIHAVSFGESVAATLIIKKILEQHPKVPVTVTNMTPTGSEKISSSFGDKVLNFYIPYDVPMLQKRFIKKIQPDAVVIIETELWPNMLMTLKKHNIPVILANGRLSQRSFKRYHKIKFLMVKLLSCFDKLLIQTQEEADRFMALGGKASQIEVTGSIKFDLSLPDTLGEKIQQLTHQLGEKRPVFMAGSTHNHEEAIIIEAYKIAKAQVPDLLLLLVPRHPDRFLQVAALCEKQGLSVVKRSETIPVTDNTDVFLGDSMGEMLLFYGVCDLTFVGGSLVPVGGHNVLEPAALCKPILTGPNMQNFLQISKLLYEAKALKYVHNYEDLAKAIIQLMELPKLRETMGKQAEKVLDQNRGALEKHIQVIKEHITIM